MKIRINRAWLTLGATIGLLDIATTWYALRIGASEGNPVQAWLFSTLGFWIGCAVGIPLDVWRASLAASLPRSDAAYARISGGRLPRKGVALIAYVAQGSVLLHAFIVVGNLIVIGSLLRP